VDQELTLYALGELAGSRWTLLRICSSKGLPNVRWCHGRHLEVWRHIRNL